MRYSRTCSSYQDVLDRGLLLTRKLLNQGFLLVELKSSLRTFYRRHHDLVDRYWISVSQMTTWYVPPAVYTSRSFPHSWLIAGLVTRLTQRVPLVGQELLTLPEHLGSAPVVFKWGSCYSIFSFMCMLCRSFYVLLYFFFWPFCCLFLIDIHIWITPLVSSNSSYNSRKHKHN